MRDGLPRQKLLKYIFLETILRHKNNRYLKYIIVCERICVYVCLCMYVRRAHFFIIIYIINIYKSKKDPKRLPFKVRRKIYEKRKLHIQKIFFWNALFSSK